jgi:amino acid adenylation domain-containing protein
MNQELKLRELLKHAWGKSSLYRELYSEAGIQEVDLDHIPLEDFPVMTKSDVMLRFDEAVTDSRLKIDDLNVWIKNDKNPLNLYLDEYIVISSSAGSNISSFVPYTLKEWRYITTQAAQILFPEDFLELGPIRSAFYFASVGHWASATNVTLASRGFHDVLSLSVMDPVEEILAKMNAFQPTRLTTYASLLSWMIEWALDGKLNISPDTVVVTGDQMTHAMRSDIKKIWGAEIFDLYASAESIFSAIRVPHNETFKVLKDVVIMEVVDSNFKSVLPGECGRVLVTNLVQKSLPLIRFDMFDYATLGSSDFGADTLISLDGKSFDNLQVRSINGSIATIPVYQLGNLQIPQLKRIQYKPYSPDHIEINYISDENLDKEINLAFQTLIGSNYNAINRVDINSVPYLNSGNGTKFYNVLNPDGRIVGQNFLRADSIPLQVLSNCLTEDRMDLLSDQIMPIHDQFSKVVPICRDRISIEDKEGECTYKYLDEISGKVARNLIHLNLNKEKPVAILCGHSMDIVVLAMGVLKAGGFFLPIDENLPNSRIESILLDTQPEVLLSDKRLIETKLDIHGTGIIAYHIDNMLNSHEEIFRFPKVSSDDPACFIYTSGSTGKPEGVILSHKTIMTRVKSYVKDYNIGPGAKVSLVQSSSVNAGIRDIFGALLSGATLSIFDLKMMGLSALKSWLQKKSVTHFYAVPTVWRLFMETLTDEQFTSIRVVRLGGEAILPDDVEGFKKHFPKQSRLAGGYATTETGTICQFFMDHDVNFSSGKVPVGFPIKGADLKITDQNGIETKDSLGNICVGGNQLALGLWDSEIKSSIPFQKAHFSTGDLGFIIDDGRVFLTGRGDRTIKIHGYRVNLDEIETTVNAIDGIDDSAAIANSISNGELRISLYYVGEPESAPTQIEIQKSLSSKLPSQAVPSYYQQMAVLPRFSGGKLNINLLPKLDVITLNNAKFVTSYTNEIETNLAEIWRDVLFISHVTREDDFFDLGGDSVMVFRALNRIRILYNVDISVMEFFTKTTLKSMATLIDEKLSLLPKKEVLL